MPNERESKPFKDGPLPDNCPPKDAIKPPKDAIFLRLVPANPPNSAHFKSSRAEGNRRQPKSCWDSRGAACSGWAERRPREQRSGLAKLRHLSDRKYLAALNAARACRY